MSAFEGKADIEWRRFNVRFSAMKPAFSSGVFVPAVAFASTWAATLAAAVSIVHPVMVAFSTDSDVRYWHKAGIPVALNDVSFGGKRTSAEDW
jgi:hypothetical protein